ncbi:helix-turn-helix domain-containing protein [Alicyclobacillus acidocaldarius]|uniref:helix-turn-helix domain-containing protein n=1 Tax=Alicyclobacillus acidocaldarius TaxID=405212 RepID=UPI0003192CD9|nr:RodZ domain-containing protein [Alicyclobacillus acidocaldarius]
MHEHLGQILRARRESLGLSVEDIEERTKIRKRYIEALESGQWDVLPGRVYARGFVRSYAEVLGLDGSELLEKYVDGGEAGSSEPGVRAEPSSQTSENRAADRKPAARMVEPRSLNEMERTRSRAYERTGASRRETYDRPVRSVGSWIGQGLLIGGALAVVGGLYVLLHQHHGQPNHGANTTTPSPQKTEATKPATHKTAPPKHATQPVKKAQPMVVALPYANGTYSYKVLNATSLQVVVSVNSGELWFSATADGQAVAPNVILNQGQSKSISAQNNVTFHLGHVEGVSITVDGQPIQLPNITWAPVVVIERG